MLGESGNRDQGSVPEKAPTMMAAGERNPMTQDSSQHCRRLTTRRTYSLVSSDREQCHWRKTSRALTQLFPSRIDHERAEFANDRTKTENAAEQRHPFPRAVARLGLETKQSPGPRHALPPAMTDVLYRCATTGQNVQVWFADDVPDDSVYISLRCPACARVHLVNRAGRTLLPPRP
jgi:hypothetical protein